MNAILAYVATYPGVFHLECSYEGVSRHTPMLLVQHDHQKHHNMPLENCMEKIENKCLLSMEI